MMRIMGIDESLEKLQSVLDSSHKAYYTRFGDGDIMLMAGKRPRTSGNQQETSEDIRRELHESLNINHPLYLRGASGTYPREIGMTDTLFGSFSIKDELDRVLLSQLTEDAPDEFYSPVLFHYLGTFKPNIFIDFIDKYIKPKSKMFIGSVNRKDMEYVFGKIDYYIETPAKNSYHTIVDWWGGIEDNYKNVDVVIPASGQSSRVIAKRLWNLNADVQCFDIGSIVDPIAGIYDTRSCWKLIGQEVKDSFL